MNETAATSAPGSSLLPEGLGALTAVHFVFIALVALAAIAIIVSGVRRRRAQHRATQEVRQHAAEAGVPPPTEEPARTEAEPERAMPEPAPAPRPLADEPIAAAAPMEASPAAEAADAPASSGDAAAPVTQLKGLGPKVAAALADRGITTVGRIAALSDDEAAALDADLGPFRGRMARDRWVEQARLLAAGDRAGFEARFGKL